MMLVIDDNDDGSGDYDADDDDYDQIQMMDSTHPPHDPVVAKDHSLHIKCITLTVAFTLRYTLNDAYCL